MCLFSVGNRDIRDCHKNVTFLLKKITVMKIIKEMIDPGRKVLDTDAGLTLNEGGKMKEGKLRGSVLDDRAVPREVWQSCWES